MAGPHLLSDLKNIVPTKNDNFKSQTVGGNLRDFSGSCGK